MITKTTKTVTVANEVELERLLDGLSTICNVSYYRTTIIRGHYQVFPAIAIVTKHEYSAMPEFNEISVALEQIEELEF